MKNVEFKSDASKLLWDLIKLNPRDLGLISLYVNLENDGKENVLFENKTKLNCELKNNKNVITETSNDLGLYC